jgi:hypothetical protein
MANGNDLDIKSKTLPPSSITGKPGQVYSENMVDTTWSKTEPLLTAEQLVYRHLFGIPLVSRFKDPFTNKPMVLTKPMVEDYIKRAVAMAELEMTIDIFPTAYSEKLPYDRAEYEDWGFMMLSHRPVNSIQLMTIRTADNQNVYEVPLEWVETANMAHGQLNIIPMAIGLVNGQEKFPAATSGGSMFLNILGIGNWVPSYWSIEYTCGFPNGCIPIVVNELIGMTAAMNILSQLAATYQQTSASLGVDGLSQSSGTVGPALFLNRMKELDTQRQLVVKKIKAMFGLKNFSSNV